MGTINLTAEFTLFPDNTILGQSFSLSSYQFNDLSGRAALFVNETAGEKGLQFPAQGVEISLPVLVEKVDLRLGAFAGPIKIIARDSEGNDIQTQISSIPNQYFDLTITAPGIASLMLVDGNNEGILVRISTQLSIH